jgi:multidrug efflux system membrane fusion protein
MNAARCAPPNPPSRLSSLPGAWAGLALLAVLLSGCTGGQADSAAAQAKAAPGVPVVVAAVAAKTMPVRLGAVGNAEPYATVAIKARIDGQIDKAYFTEGQEVRAGDLLFQLDPRPLKADLAQAEAKLAGDEAQLRNALAKDRRYQDLLARNFVSKDFYAQVRTDFDSAQALVRADRAAVDNARVQLEYTTIRAPVGGRTGKMLLQPGNLVKANDTDPLVVINQISPIHVSFSVPEQHLEAVRAGLARGPLAVSAAPPQGEGPAATGRLAFVDNAVDTATGTIRLKAVFDNRDHALWPGQFLQVTLILREQPDALVVPAAAVQSGPKGQYVFVVAADGKAELRPVVVDRSEADETVIAQGLKAGERVVVSGQLRVAPGSAVTVQEGGA